MKRPVLIVIISILAGSIVVFVPTLFTYFSQDDWVFLSHVYKRPWIDIFRYYPEAFYRPIGQQLFFKIGSVLFGLNPAGYHVLALGIHVLNTMLLWKILNRFFRHSELSEATPRNLAKRFILIIFYSLHPVHLIALNWLTQVDIEIAAMFSLLTILTFDRWFLLSVATFVAALLSHETAAMLPMMLMLQGRSFHTEGPSLNDEKDPTLRFQGRTLRNRLISLFCVALIVLLVKYFLNPFPFQSDYSLGIYPIQLFSTIKWYVLRALFLPEGIRALPVAIQALSVLSAGLIILLFRRQLLRALLVFIVGLAPVLLFSQHVFSVYAVLPVLWMVLELGKLTSERVILEGAKRPTCLQLPSATADGGQVGSPKDSIASARQTGLRSRMTVVTALVLFVSSFFTSRSVLPIHWTTTRGEISRKLTEEFDASVKRSDLAARSDLMKRMDFSPASEPSFASMMGKQFEVLERDLTK